MFFLVVRSSYFDIEAPTAILIMFCSIVTRGGDAIAQWIHLTYHPVPSTPSTLLSLKVKKL